MKNEKTYLFDNPKNIKRVLHVLYGCCALLIALDFIIHRHVIHSWEKLSGFYAIFGFVSCVILVFVATWMRTFLKREQGYYDNEGLFNKDLGKGDGVNKEKQDVDKKPGTKLGEHNVDD